MDYSGLLVRDDYQVNEEKPPARVCPRCNSDNTKFCYYNNYSASQPRYKCKNCRRYWTHGGTLRNVPIGGKGRKIKRTRIDQPSISQVVSVENHQVNHHQPFLHDQETDEFVGSSAAAAVGGNHFGSLLEFHGDMVTNVPPFGCFPPREALHISDVSFGQGYYYNIGCNDLIGNPMVNQIAGGPVVVRSDQEDPNMWNMDHSASTAARVEPRDISLSTDEAGTSACLGPIVSFGPL